MADVNYIVPGSGIIQDQENGYEMIVPGFGIYDEQEAAGGGISMPVVMLQMDQFDGGAML